MRRNKYFRGLLVLGLAVIFVALSFYIIWNLPEWQLDTMSPEQLSKLSVQQRLEVESNMRSSEGQIVSGIAIAAGLIVTWLQLAYSSRQQEETQRTTLAQLSIDRANQNTQLFTKAIDQIGSNTEDVRIGGIFALDRLAKDAQEYYWPIMEILTAYIRRHCTWKPSQQSYASMSETIEDFRKKAFDISRPPADISSILTVLRNRKGFYGNSETDPICLDRSNMSHGDLWRAHLEKADFRTSCLDWADLREAHLNGARMEEAWLRGALLIGADLTDAHLDGADLRGANVSGAILNGADLRGANLMDIENLTKEQIAQAHLGWSEIEGSRHLTVLPKYLKYLASPDVAE